MDYKGLTQNFNLIYDKLYDNKKNLRQQLDMISEFSKLLNEFQQRLSKVQQLYAKPEHEQHNESMIVPLNGYFTFLQQNLQQTATALTELEIKTEQERRKLSDSVRDKQKVFNAVYQPVATLRQQLQKHEQKLRETYKKLEHETDKGKILQLQRAGQDMEKQQAKMVARIRQMEEKVDGVIPLQTQPIQQIDAALSGLIEKTNTQISTILQQFSVQQIGFIQQNFIYQSAQSNIDTFFNLHCNNFSTTFVQTKVNDIKLEEGCKQGARVAEMVSKQNLRKIQSTTNTPQNGALDKAVLDASKTGPAMPKNLKAGDDIPLEDIFGSIQAINNPQTSAQPQQQQAAASWDTQNQGYPTQNPEQSAWDPWNVGGNSSQNAAGTDWGFNAQQPAAQQQATTAATGVSSGWDVTANNYNYQPQTADSWGTSWNTTDQGAAGYTAGQDQGTGYTPGYDNNYGYAAPTDGAGGGAQNDGFMDW